METLRDVCKNRAKCIYEFAKEVFKIKLYEEPDYEKLRIILVNCLNPKPQRRISIQ